MDINSSLTSSYRVYAEDTDFMGIVYHSNYLCFFERARTDFLREIGLPLSLLATYDCHFAIHTAQLRYLNPARLEDLLVITTKIGSISPCSLVFDQNMQKQDNTMLCQLKIKIACVNQSLKPKRLPELFIGK